MAAFKLRQINDLKMRKTKWVKKMQFYILKSAKIFRQKIAI